MSRVEIRTNDAAWIARNATPGRDGRVIVTVPSVEHLTFAGKRHVRFVLPTPPNDGCGQTVWMSPAEWLVDA